MTITRDKLLDTSCSILERGRVDALTIDALAQSLRMSKSTLYKHFEGKDALLDAVARRACDLTLAELDGAPANGRFDARIAALFGVWTRHAERVPRAMLVTPDRLPRGARQALDLARERFEAALATACRDGIDRGDARTAPLEPLAAGLVAMVEGAIARAALGGSARGAVVDALSTVVLSGLSLARQPTK
jgi:AcrR family transcriptional regulator